MDAFVTQKKSQRLEIRKEKKKVFGLGHFPLASYFFFPLQTLKFNHDSWFYQFVILFSQKFEVKAVQNFHNLRTSYFVDRRF